MKLCYVADTTIGSVREVVLKMDVSDTKCILALKTYTQELGRTYSPGWCVQLSGKPTDFVKHATALENITSI